MHEFALPFAARKEGTGSTEPNRDRQDDMRFLSTRGATPPTSVDAALVAGLAPDGGLFVPERLASLAGMAPRETLAGTAHTVLEPYFADSVLRDRLGEICAQAFSFDAPLSAM